MKRIFKLAVLLSLWGPFLLSSSLPATTITINYIGSGYTDPTPVEPVGGNPGTTLGEQRRNAVRFAADIWQATLDSDVEIKINSSFSLLTCGVLAQTGTGQYGFDFPEAPFPNTLYHGALANKLHGSDLFSGAANMTVTFNSGYDTTCGGGWYYGYDNNHGTSFDLIAVSLHEFGHGLGFSTPTSSTSGAFFLGRPSIYDRFVFDNTQGLHWHEMPTNANRVTSAINFRNVAWDGPQVTGAVSSTLQLGFPFLQVNSPKSIAGNYVDTAASFGPRLPNDGVTSNVVLADDGVPPTSDACEPLVNGKEINGNIALIDRGNCNFTVKVKNAQDAGAIGVIMVNNVAGTPIAMGGSIRRLRSLPLWSLSRMETRSGSSWETVSTRR